MNRIQVASPAHRKVRAVVAYAVGEKVRIFGTQALTAAQQSDDEALAALDEVFVR